MRTDEEHAYQLATRLRVVFSFYQTWRELNALRASAEDLQLPLTPSADDGATFLLVLGMLCSLFDPSGVDLTSLNPGEQAFVRELAPILEKWREISGPITRIRSNIAFHGAARKRGTDDALKALQDLGEEGLTTAFALFEDVRQIFPWLVLESSKCRIAPEHTGVFEVFLEARNAARNAILTAREAIARENGAADTERAYELVCVAVQRWEDAKKAISTDGTSESNKTFIAVWDAQVQDLQSTVEQLRTLVNLKDSAQSLGIEVERTVQSAMTMSIRVFAGSLAAWSHSAKSGRLRISPKAAGLLHEVYEKAQELGSTLERDAGQPGNDSGIGATQRR